MRYLKQHTNFFCIVLSALCLVLSVSCKKIDVYEKTAFFPNHEWKTVDTKRFDFVIEDTTSQYNVYVVIRHEDAYRYKNIWLDINMKGPADTAQSTKKEFLLADNTHWLGSAMDDIIEHRLIYKTFKAKKQGSFSFVLSQAMREEPLQYILNAGIRVEKVKP